MLSKDIFFCLPNFSAGGAERVMIAILNSILDKKAIKCVVLDNKGPLKTLLSSDVKLLDLNCNSARSAILKLSKIFRMERPAIVFSTMAYFNFAVMLGLLFSGHKPEKIVLREANTPSSTLGTNGYRIIYRQFYRWLYNRADIIIANSNQVRAELIELKVDYKKIHLIPNPVDVKNIHRLAKEHKEIPEFSNPALPLFVSIGRLAHQKGMDRLINWLSRMSSQANLLIIGDGKLRKKLESQCNALGVSDQVVFLGFQSNPFPFLLSANAFVLASRWEGLPNAALESLALGKRVIATFTSGGLPELKSKVSEGFLVIAETEKAFIDAMEETARCHDTKHSCRPAVRLPREFYHEVVIDKYKAALQLNVQS